MGNDSNRLGASSLVCDKVPVTVKSSQRVVFIFQHSTSNHRLSLQTELSPVQGVIFLAPVLLKCETWLLPECRKLPKQVSCRAETRHWALSKRRSLKHAAFVAK